MYSRGARISYLFVSNARHSLTIFITILMILVFFRTPVRQSDIIAITIEWLKCKSTSTLIKTFGELSLPQKLIQEQIKVH